MSTARQEGNSSMEEVVVGTTIHSTGVVTLWEEGFPRGVIDGYYKFQKALAYGGTEIKKGSKVEFAAKFSDSFEWEVTAIKLHVSQEEIDRESRRKFRSITGEVVNLNSEFAFVKYGKGKEDVQLVPVPSLPKAYDVKQGTIFFVNIIITTQRFV